MKLLRVLCILAFCATPALADPDVPEIHLGKTPAVEPAADHAQVSAVEHWLASRQAGSLNRDHVSAPHNLIRSTQHWDDVALFGPKGTWLVAYNFHDESIASLGSGRFSVSVYLLFGNGAGQVVESRDEELFFSHEDDGYACTSLRLLNLIAWTQDGVRDEAAAAGASQEFARAERFLSDGALGQTTWTTYSLEAVQKRPDGRVVVQCLRFRSDPGKRGFDVSSTPIVLSRSDDSIRIESN